MYILCLLLLFDSDSATTDRYMQINYDMRVHRHSLYQSQINNYSVRSLRSDAINKCTCYSPDRPANKSWISLFAGRKLCRMWLGARFSVHASVYLQRTLIPPKVPNPCFAHGYRLDRLLDERSVVPASRGYRPLINLPPSFGK